MEAPDDMKAAGQEFLAEEHADQARVAEKVAAMNEANAPAEPPPSEAPPAAGPTGADSAAAKAQLEAMAVIAQKIMPLAPAILWGVIDGLVVKFAGREYALTPDEKNTLVVGTQPLITKYMPADLLAWLETPEGLAIGSIVLVYGVKYATVQGVPLFASLTGAPAPAAPSSPPASPLEQRVDKMQPAETVTAPAAATMPSLGTPA